MSRPLRIDFAGALYHITSRGDRGEAIYDDDVDRSKFLTILSEVIERYNWLCHAYCLMTNHYHLIVETPHANLSKGMRQLNGVYAQASNRRHQRTGHVFQGRFKGIIVDKDRYLLELTRYVVLNPVRAKMVSEPGDWPWSSFGAMVGLNETPVWLATDRLLAQFSMHRTLARQQYRGFVAGGLSAPSVWTQLRQQIYLGDDEFIRRAQHEVRALGDKLTIPRIQRKRPTISIEDYFTRCNNRDSTIRQAYESGDYSYSQISDHFGISRSTVCRIVQRQR